MRRNPTGPGAFIIKCYGISVSEGNLEGLAGSSDNVNALVKSHTAGLAFVEAFAIERINGEWQIHLNSAVSGIDNSLARNDLIDARADIT